MAEIVSLAARRAQKRAEQRKAAHAYLDAEARKAAAGLPSAIKIKFTSDEAPNYRLADGTVIDLTWIDDDAVRLTKRRGVRTKATLPCGTIISWAGDEVKIERPRGALRSSRRKPTPIYLEKPQARKPLRLV